MNQHDNKHTSMATSAETRVSDLIAALRASIRERLDHVRWAREAKEHVDRETARLNYNNVQIAEFDRKITSLRQELELNEGFPHGRSLEADLSTMNTLYMAGDDIPSDMFIKRAEIFTNLWRLSTEGDRCYRVWVTDRQRDKHVFDIFRRGNIWYDSSGQPLPKWGTYILADHDIMFDGMYFYRMVVGFPVSHYKAWVCYPLMAAQASQ